MDWLVQGRPGTKTNAFEAVHDSGGILKGLRGKPERSARWFAPVHWRSDVCMRIAGAAYGARGVWEKVWGSSV